MTSAQKRPRVTQCENAFRRKSSSPDLGPFSCNTCDPNPLLIMKRRWERETIFDLKRNSNWKCLTKQSEGNFGFDFPHHTWHGSITRVATESPYFSVSFLSVCRASERPPHATSPSNHLHVFYARDGVGVGWALA